MASIVRHSKFRHVFGTEARKDNSFEDFRPTNCAYDGTFIAANQKLLAFCVDVGGAGAFSVIPIDKPGRLGPNTPKVTAHKEYVLDLKWNPFNDNMLASCSEDGSIRIWEFDDMGPLINMEQDKAALPLIFHERRCTQVAWHPVADNVLMSVSQEPKICIWNLDDGTCDVEFDNLSCIVYNAEWSSKGDKIVTVSKDKKFRIYDARSKELLCEGAGHEGAKPQRVLFTFDDTMLFSCGFSKMSERQFGCWKINGEKLENLDIVELDTANGVLVPFYDADTHMVYLAAKGDTVIRYYEIQKDEPYYYYVSTFQSKDTSRSLCPIPKRNVDVNSCEVMRFYKMILAKVNMIKPISFTVPRKSDLFQDDIYPDALSAEAALEAGDWFEGKNAEPNRVPMQTFFKGKLKPVAGAPGGGLKKGGLKGLKAKKDAKAAAKKDTPVPAAAAAPAVRKTPSPEPPKSQPSKPSAVAQSAPPTVVHSGVDEKVVKELKDEINSMKDNAKKMQREIKSLTDKVKDYDKLTGDIKLLCDAVKKNDERLVTLEALVQEESDTEDNE